MKLREAAQNLALIAFYTGLGVAASTAFMEGTVKVQEDREAAAKQQQIIDDDLVNAIIQVESSGNPKAVSNKGAMGLMQIMPLWVPTLKKEGIILAKKDLLEPNRNIKAGKYILIHYMNHHKGDLKKTLKSYSGGHKGYYRKVMKEINHEKD